MNVVCKIVFSRYPRSSDSSIFYEIFISRSYIVPILIFLHRNPYLFKPSYRFYFLLFFSDGDQIRVMADLHCLVFHPAPVLFDGFKNIIRIHLFFICHGLIGMRSYPFIFLSQFREPFFCFLICQWISFLYCQKIISLFFIDCIYDRLDCSDCIYCNKTFLDI